MIDRQNLVGFVERALLLKTLPILRDATGDQIAAIVNSLRDRSFMPGAALFRAGELPVELHLIFDGDARLQQADGPIARGPGELVGLLDAVAQSAHAADCVSETAVHTLALRADDLFDLLEDFFDLSRVLLARLAAHVGARHGDEGNDALFDGDGTSYVARSEPLDLIDKIVVMKGAPLLAGASIDELARLGAEVREVTYGAGEVVTAAGERADAFYLVLRGRLGARKPRASVGALDVLRQESFSATVVAAEPSRVLRVPAERYFDLLEDHFEMALGVARRLAGAARDGSPAQRRATAA